MRVKILPVVLASLVIPFFAAQADTAVKCTFKSLGSCPNIGCAKPGTPLAVTNSLKRTTAISGRAKAISFTNLQHIQDAVVAELPANVAGQQVKSPRSMRAAARKIILSSPGHEGFSEGDFVELTGFIAATVLPPHPNTGESVNCKLKDESSNDYHINITPNKNSNEVTGVVVEMIPQDPHRRNSDWDLDKLDVIRDKQLPVRIQGRLFFDNEHVPNTKASGKAGGNPRRFSVWEIHPISAFFVCPSGNCPTKAGWTALEDWKP